MEVGGSWNQCSPQVRRISGLAANHAYNNHANFCAIAESRLWKLHPDEMSDLSHALLMPQDYDISDARFSTISWDLSGVSAQLPG